MSKVVIQPDYEGFNAVLDIAKQYDYNLEIISLLNEDIPYMHVNDNLGDVDSEFAIGEGNIDWKVFSDAIKEAKIYPQIVFEVNSLENTMKSIIYF